MRRRSFFCLTCQAGLTLAATAVNAQHAEFRYTGPEGPGEWGRLNPAWQSCSAGVNQSPIDLGRFIEARLPPLAIAYGDVGREVENTGHAIQVNAAPGATLGIDGHSFTLLQFHFHAPSEHQLEGRSFPLEAHLVHRSAEGELAVIGVMFQEGAPNEVLGHLAPSLPLPHGQKRPLGRPITPAHLLPTDRSYIRYNGSLTTPPCSEGVRWLVMRHPMSASPAQIAAISGALGFGNNRPVQPIGARPVLR